MHISAKCSVAVHCLIFISEYGAQGNITSALLSQTTGIHPATIRSLLSALKKEGVLSVKNGAGGALLAVPAGEITLYRICKAIEPDFLDKLVGVHPSPSPLCPVGRNIRPVLEHSYQKIRRDLAASLERITLEEMVADYHRQLQQES